MRAVSYRCVLGQVLAHHRRASGRTQGWICLELGIAQACFSRIETGTQVLTVDRFAALSKAYGVEPSEMLAQVSRAVTKLSRQGIYVELRPPEPFDLAPEVVRGLVAMEPKDRAPSS